ncbi:MAG: hypothetical protein PVF65_12090 [Sphingomonadales bacterium]|jgi:hypothetical protein
MSYQAGIPLGTDNPSDSATDFRNNFGQIDTVVAVNHVQFNDADAGKHKFLQMPDQSSAPTTASNEGALYTKAVTGVTQLFFREENNGTERQMTGAFTAASSGELIIPGGLTLKWGTATTAGTTLTVTYPSPFSTATYNVQITSLSAGATTIFSSSSYVAASFLCTSSNPNESFSWLAIGS